MFREKAWGTRQASEITEVRRVNCTSSFPLARNVCIGFVSPNSPEESGRYIFLGSSLFSSHCLSLKSQNGWVAPVLSTFSWLFFEASLKLPLISDSEITSFITSPYTMDGLNGFSCFNTKQISKALPWRTLVIKWSLD